MKMFVTYGYGSNLRSNFSVVEGEDVAACYEQINAVCKDKYAFAYTDEGFAGQQERWNLIEVPLQAQVKHDTL